MPGTDHEGHEPAEAAPAKNHVKSSPVQRNSRDKGRSVPRGVERALRAVRNQFERDLSSEWNAARDAPTIRNAMESVRNRCRLCKKPYAGVGDICSCRGRIEQERCVLNPRDAFLELFRQRSEGIVTSAALTKFVEEITYIAAANGFGLNWIEGETRALMPVFKTAIRNWIVDTCSSPSMQTGTLPAWFKQKTDVICDAEVQRQLNNAETEAELKAIESDIEVEFEEAIRAALDYACVSMAQVERRTRTVRPDVRASLIATVKRDNPGASIERVCVIVDSKRCPVRKVDKQAGFSTWYDAWKDLRNRNRVKRYISGIPPAAFERGS